MHVTNVYRLAGEAIVLKPLSVHEARQLFADAPRVEWTLLTPLTEWLPPKGIENDA
jgi:hypothetical protein